MRLLKTAVGCVGASAAIVISGCYSGWAGAQGGRVDGVARAVVIAGPAVPNELMKGRIGRASHVMYDVSILLRDLVAVRWYRSWGGAEGLRAKALRSVLSGIEDMGAAAVNNSDACLCGNIARVAGILLDSAMLAHGGVVDVEADEVINGGRGEMRFLRSVEACSWGEARPRGAYERDAWAGLFRATVYLRVYWNAMPRSMQMSWEELANAADSSAREDLRRASRALELLFGASCRGPGSAILGQVPFCDAAVLGVSGGTPWERLSCAIMASGGGNAASVRDAIMQTVSTLAREVPADEWLRPLGLNAWRTKWLDAAEWTYVGVRETDALLLSVGTGESAILPTLLVEPLENTFMAMRMVYAKMDEVDRLLGVASPRRGGCDRMDDVLALLRAQRLGGTPDREVLQRLWWDVLGAAELAEMEPVAMELQGMGVRVRRSGCYLVSVPVLLDGRLCDCLAFRVFVEVEEAGVWNGPPWGCELVRGRLPELSGK